jgi:TPR repeat protein
MLQVIKIVKESLRLGLKEAKDIVDSAPCVITTDVPRSEAEYLKRALEEEGAKVKIEPVSVLDGPENRGKSKAEEEANRKAEEEKKRLENMPKAKELYDRGKAKTKGLFSANYKEARALFEESLALGYGDAAYEIAEMYKLGIGGCEKNLQEYLRLIDRGIELHSSYTAEKAAKDFRIGSGAVPKDIMKSSIYEGIVTGIRNKYE